MHANKVLAILNATAACLRQRLMCGDRTGLKRALTFALHTNTVLAIQNASASPSSAVAMGPISAGLCIYHAASRALPKRVRP